MEVFVGWLGIEMNLCYVEVCVLFAGLGLRVLGFEIDPARP